jgi:hypothetical protein
MRGAAAALARALDQGRRGDAEQQHDQRGHGLHTAHPGSTAPGQRQGEVEPPAAGIRRRRNRQIRPGIVAHERE